MAIFQLTKDALSKIPETEFGRESIFERRDLQRLLRANIAVLDEGLLVIAEEFGSWQDSSRRIDLLCLDTSANLVVIELKRTQDGGHMELQALRYAAMVSPMTFEQTVQTYADTLSPGTPDLDEARARVLSFLGWTTPDQGEFGSDVRIILVAADFSRELTTTVLWLNERELSIRAVRMKPYRMPGGELLVDVQQVIPLPEAEEYQVRLEEKKREERESRAHRYDERRRFWEGLLAYSRTMTELHSGNTPTSRGYISSSLGRSGFNINYVVLQHQTRVEVYIELGAGRGEDNLRAFNALKAKRASLEATFGAALDWQDLPDSEACRICRTYDGGYRDPPDTWPAIYATLVEAMIQLDRAFRPTVHEVQL
jgi:hypothetical protein